MEVLVAAAIGVVLLFVSSDIYGRVVRLSARDAALAEMQETTSRALERLVTDLSLSQESSLCLGPVQGSGAGSLSLQPIDRVTPDSKLLYGARLITYAWSRPQGQLIRQEWPAEQAGGAELDARVPLTLEPERVQSLGLEVAPARWILIEGVEDFYLETDALGQKTRPLVIHLRVERAVPYGTRRQTFELQRAYVWES